MLDDTFSLSSDSEKIALHGYESQLHPKEQVVKQNMELLSIMSYFRILRALITNMHELVLRGSCAEVA